MVKSIYDMDIVNGVLQSEFLVDFLARSHEWSLKTFGPGKRTKGIIKHIQKELVEIEQKPTDLEEWADIGILAFDGYCRHGGTPIGFILAMVNKMRKNQTRTWPNPTSEDEPSEHIRD